MARKEVAWAFDKGRESAVQEIIQKRTGGLIWRIEPNNTLNKQIETVAAKLEGLHAVNCSSYNMQLQFFKKPTRSMTI